MFSIIRSRIPGDICMSTKGQTSFLTTIAYLNFSNSARLDYIALTEEGGGDYDFNAAFVFIFNP